MRLLAIVACVFVAICSVGPGTAQQARGQLHLLESRPVTTDTRVVRFALATTQGKVGAIRLVAKKGSIVISRVVVTYANGRVHYEEREKPINLLAGERTREIDPRLDEGFLQGVEVEVASVSGPAELELHVVQTAAGRAARRDVGGGERSFGAPRTRSIDRAAGAADPRFVAVEVYYGTNRKTEKPRTTVDGGTGETRTLQSYGPSPQSDVTLGRAVVTIPKDGRAKGEITKAGFVASFLRGEDPARDFTLVAVERLSEDEFKVAARTRVTSAKNFPGQAFVFVHGYNVSFDDALFRTAQLAHDMEFDGLPLTFSWPSAGSLVSYFLDQRRWPLATDALRKFLDLVSTETGATTIHLIAHSMGANPMIETLASYASTPLAGTKPRFSELILAAPDMTVERFEQLASKIRGQARGITLFASNNDWALVASRTFTRGVDPVGYVATSGTPVVALGVDTIDISAMNSGAFSLGHSTFADREILINDIKALLHDEARRNPSARQPAFHAVPTETSRYWRYAP